MTQTKFQPKEVNPAITIIVFFIIFGAGAIFGFGAGKAHKFFSVKKSLDDIELNISKGAL